MVLGFKPKVPSSDTEQKEAATSPLEHEAASRQETGDQASPSGNSEAPERAPSWFSKAAHFLGIAPEQRDPNKVYTTGTKTPVYKCIMRRHSTVSSQFLQFPPSSPKHSRSFPDRHTQRLRGLRDSQGPPALRYRRLCREESQYDEATPVQRSHGRLCARE